MKDIIEIIEEAGIELKPLNDKSLRGFCPFHDDRKTPNLTVYKDTQSWYCFGCHSGGDSMSFVMKFYKLSYDDAIKRLYGEDIYQPLKDRIEKEQTDVDYRGVLNRLVSRLAYQKMRSNPEKADEVMNLLQDFDKKMFEYKVMSREDMDLYFKSLRQVL